MNVPVLADHSQNPVVDDAPITLAQPPPRTLLVVEVDEAFANVYSTAVSTQNVATRLDRRWLALIVGVVSTLLALTFDLTLPTFFTGTGAAWTSWWAARQQDLGIEAANGWSASLVSLAVAMALAALVSLPAIVRHRRRGPAV